ncbi:3-dehydroquinate synthase [Verrucomicrobiaceae bacterium SCGC AG-212-N21]|nr:3-dehydroquinate synthase [Verrucomicrobiaceae bacterium SCGC AG-212-N21]
MRPATTPISLADALRAARETRALEIGSGILHEVPRVFREHFGSREAVIVADENTMKGAGDAVLAAFKDAGHPTRAPFVFPAQGLYAEHRFVEQLEPSLRAHDAIPVVVGSGTLNDLTKLAAHRTGRSYVCVATAASMDGYTAFGASITYNGSKQTFDCPAPTAVVADLDVIACAPAAMSGWGYADLLAKVTAGADWIIADALGVEPIEPLAWNIVQGRLREAVADPTGIRAGNASAFAGLVEGLMLGGFAMQATKSSRPASGAEHQFSHLWDMQHHTHEGSAPSHGLKVGIGTLAVTALYEQLLALPLDALDIMERAAAWPEKEMWLQQAAVLFPEPDLHAVATREITAKHSSPAELADQLNTVRKLWPDLRDQLNKQLIPFGTLREMLRSAGAATEPEEIGIPRARLRESFMKAFFIRRRFTVLDLAMRTGLLGSSLDRIFGPQGTWPATASPTPTLHVPY